MKKSRTSSQQNHPSGYTPWALVTVEDDALDYFSSSNNKWSTQRNHPLSSKSWEVSSLLRSPTPNICSLVWSIPRSCSESEAEQSHNGSQRITTDDWGPSAVPMSTEFHRLPGNSTMVMDRIRVVFGKPKEPWMNLGWSWRKYLQESRIGREKASKNDRSNRSWWCWVDHGLCWYFTAVLQGQEVCIKEREKKWCS